MNSDFKDLLSAFNAHGVECLVVGAFALAAHGRIRATGDIDIWVRPSTENAAGVLKALVVFGAPLHDLTATDLSRPGLVFQIGIAPLRIDILTGIDGVEFPEAWSSRIETRIGDQPVGVLSVEHMIRNKRAAGRAQYLADLEWLENPDQRDL